jgi:hypothetical protein
MKQDSIEWFTGLIPRRMNKSIFQEICASEALLLTGFGLSIYF